MNFYDAFLDEMAKLGEDSAGSPDMDQQEFTPPTAEQPAGPASPGSETAGDFAGADSRRELQGMLGSTEGRQEIRKAFTGLRSKIDELVGVRKAFNRGLVRAHREIFGPTATPNSDLRRLLYKEEPFAETESA
jgi:hypothetical protein